ncbi:MAG: DEAD/DEAH box helicase family protein [Methanobacteriaceae archaeon]|nr:DEAD/DEAH box helicase family protein [Methanobacteriaceae archaeon]MDO9626859.1 DEAD/DEAH box helicase family protein [Methanobacteriaceae archaeon]
MDSYTDDVSQISEHKTRKEYIDPLLERTGWLDKYIKEEVNSVKSNFKNKNIIYFNGSVERGVDRFIDYVLLDEDYTPLAIIEAKRFSKDPDIGRIQARSYAQDIESQVGFKVPIFLTNGQKWVLIDEYGIERKVSGPFSQSDLKRRRDLYNNRKDPRGIKLNTYIVDRPRSVQIVRKLSEHFAECHRTALIEMATGTGKTRVAMAIIDLLIKANMVRNVLFIADRVALVRQAKDNGFKKYFTEPVADLRNGFNDNSRLYVTTVQTLMQGKETRLFEKFSPGFFDLIVFDEAHRSIYDRNNLIYQYFDCIKIGLTATPRERETQSTFDLFGKATVEYAYDEAVRDGVLVPYFAHIISTKVLNEGIKPENLDKFLKDHLRRQKVDPDELELTGSQFDRVFMDDKTNALIIKSFMEYCYKSDEGKPAKSIFFCASRNHAKHMKKVFGELFPKFSDEVQVITSNMARNDDEVERFKKQSNPRIALSVGMLDTGVDIPEICNLVFVKPVYSPIRFWQMLGRGTRNLQACKHKDWLPSGKKNDFLIFDFMIGGHSNIEYHELERGKGTGVPNDVLTTIFNNRVALLDKDLTVEQKELITGKIRVTMDELNEEFFLVREKASIISKIKNSDDLEGFVDPLIEEISPLMITQFGSNSKVSSFILKSEKLFECILDLDKEKIDKIRREVVFMISNVMEKDNLQVISEKKPQLIKARQSEFWEDLTFEDVEFLVTEVAPLMKYFEPTGEGIIDIPVADVITDWKKFEKEVQEDEELKRLLERNESVRKLKEGHGINSGELLDLERELSSLKPEITIEYIQKQQNIDFLQFLRDIIGLSRDDDPRMIIEKRFNDYIVENVHYTSRQVEFLMLLKKVFSERKHIEMKDLGGPPFEDENPLDLFSYEELVGIVDKCNRIRMC